MKSINWYPGHMVKTKRQIKENLKYVDVVFELIDARIPYSSKIKEEIALNKKTVLIITKYDLCDKKITDKWIKHYQDLKYQVVFLDLINGNVKELLKVTENIMALETKKRIEKGMLSRKIRIMIIGVPNVGKSTLINRLVSKKAVKVANKPGVTTSLSWIRINEKIELLDTPGILSPQLESDEVALNLASFSAIKEEILPIEEVVNHILTKLINQYPDILKQRYGVEANSPEAVFQAIAKNRGCLSKNNEINYEKTNYLIINDLKNGAIKNITFDFLEV